MHLSCATSAAASRNRPQLHYAACCPPRAHTRTTASTQRLVPTAVGSPSGQRRGQTKTAVQQLVCLQAAFEAAAACLPACLDGQVRRTSIGALPLPLARASSPPPRLHQSSVWITVLDPPYVHFPPPPSLLLSILSFWDSRFDLLPHRRTSILPSLRLCAVWSARLTEASIHRSAHPLPAYFAFSESIPLGIFANRS